MRVLLIKLVLAQGVLLHVREYIVFYKNNIYFSREVAELARYFAITPTNVFPPILVCFSHCAYYFNLMRRIIGLLREM